MNKRSFSNRRRYLMIAMLIVMLLCALALAFRLPLLPVIAPMIAIILWHFYRCLLKEREYQALCRRFAEGEVDRDWFEQIRDWDEALVAAMSRADTMIDRQSAIQLSTRQAEYLALQNQINPHFLYNTLDAIRGDALMIGADNIADITEALSLFFRYSITNTQNLVTLQEELDNVDNYFLIQKYRFEDKLDLTVRLEDDALLRAHMPKLSLQPIVENAIFHGIERTRGGGLIEITARIVDDSVHITVSDNGRGMDADQLTKLNEKLLHPTVEVEADRQPRRKGGIALRNVSRRIKLLFGEQYGLQVSSVPGVGTSVLMTLPLDIQKDEA